MGAGYSEVAEMFYGHAVHVDPENANYRARHLDALADCDPSAAERLAVEILESDEAQPPIVVAQAAYIRVDVTRAPADPQSAQLCRELIQILERNMSRIENDESTPGRTTAFALTAGLLGLCHELIGNIGAAVSAYTRVLHANPNDGGLLMARGTLQYGTSPHAIDDLERAISLGSPVVWPYLFLAHLYLATRRFEECRVMCETGLRMSASDTAKSQLEEWRAIAQAELGFPVEAVSAAFETAVRLDPTNELARQNQREFEASFGVSNTRLRVKWVQKSEAAVRQFRLAERRYSFAA